MRLSSFASWTLPVLVFGCSADGNPATPQWESGASTSSTTSSSSSSSSSGTGGAPANPTGGAAAGPSVDLDAGNGEADQCGEVHFDLVRKPAEILLVFDRSGSMEETVDEDAAVSDTNPVKWSLAVPPVTQVITETDSSVSWGLKLFPVGTDTGACDASSVVPDIDVPIGPANGAAIIDAIGTTTPTGDGTPTGHSIQAAVNYLSTIQNDNPKYIVLATDGEPSCDESLSDSQDSARPFATAQVAAAYAAGYPVFVIGVATTKDTATLALNDMAVAGGAPRSDPNPLATKYYLAVTQQELIDALRAITGEFLGCVFPLGSTPPVVENIGVKVNGVLAPRDMTRTNGWDYTNAESTEVEVYGEWCEQIKTAAANMVEIIFGCPNKPVE
jgi:Mg-chelatase subunit ChlD